MKTLTIRLTDEDLETIRAIKDRSTSYSCSTINGTIRYALRLVEQYTNLHTQLIDLFTPKWEVNQKKLQELNRKYGFLQGKIFD